MTKMIIPIALIVVVALGIVAFAEHGLDRLRAQTHEIIMGAAARQAEAVARRRSVSAAAGAIARKAAAQAARAARASITARRS